MAKGKPWGEGDRVALITGGASGIGLATAQRLIEAEIGALVLVDRDEVGLRLAAQALSLPAGRLLCRAHDVADESAWEQTRLAITEQFGRLDFAVVNAGIADGGAIVDYPFAAWRRVLATNLDGAFLGLQHSLQLIGEGERGGAIVVVSSAAALKAEPGTAAYAASKAGVLQLARVAAKEGADRRIRVNAVLPGGVKTPIWRTVPFFRELVEQEGGEEAAFNALASLATPLGRYADAAEIAGQIVLLLSDEAATMTGAAVTLDGGYSL